MTEKAKNSPGKTEGGVVQLERKQFLLTPNMELQLAEKSVPAEQIEKWLATKNLEYWRMAAVQPGLTGPQAFRLAYEIGLVPYRKSVSHEKFNGERGARLGAIAYMLLTHPNSKPDDVAEPLSASNYPEVWLQLVRFVQDVEILRSVHEKNQQYLLKCLSTQYCPQKAHDVQEALAQNPATPADALDDLARYSQVYWLDVVRHPQCGDGTLSYIAVQLDWMPEKAANAAQILEVISQHPAINPMRKIQVEEAQRYLEMEREAQNVHLPESELIALADACKVDKHVAQVRKIAQALSSHPNTTSRVMNVLALSPQSMAKYFVARSPYTRESALAKLVSKQGVLSLRERNPLVYESAVRELLRNSSMTDDLLAQLVANSDDPWLWKEAVCVLTANEKTLTEVLWKVSQAAVLPEETQRDLIAAVILHPNCTDDIRSKDHDGMKPEQYSMIAECNRRRMEHSQSWNEYREWGEREIYDCTLLTPYGAMAYQHELRDKVYTTASITPEILRRALHHEWLRADLLDLLVTDLVYRTSIEVWERALAADRIGMELLLEELVQNAHLSIYARNMLKTMKKRMGSTLRKLLNEHYPEEK